MLLTEIRRNQKLAAKRNPMYDRNRFAKFLIYLFTAFWAAYLILIGVTLPIALKKDSLRWNPTICSMPVCQASCSLIFCCAFFFLLLCSKSNPTCCCRLKATAHQCPARTGGTESIQSLLALFLRPLCRHDRGTLLWCNRCGVLCTRNLASDGGQRLLECTGAHIAASPHSLGTASRGMLCPAGSRRIFLFIR